MALLTSFPSLSWILAASSTPSSGYVCRLLLTYMHTSYVFFFLSFCSYLGYQINRSPQQFYFDFHSPYCPCLLFPFTILSSNIYREAIVDESYLLRRLITSCRLLQHCNRSCQRVCPFPVSPSVSICSCLFVDCFGWNLLRSVFFCSSSASSGEIFCITPIFKAFCYYRVLYE